MPRAVNPQLSVERFFQLSLLGLVSSGYLAVAGSGYLDAPTVILTGLGLILRGLIVTGLLRFQIPDRLALIATVAYIGFYPVDYFFLSGAFLESTVHLVFFLAVVKILTARTNRDYLYTAMIAFLEILAAAILSASLNFLLFLALYLLSAIAAFTSAEIRRAMQKPHQIARAGLRRFHPRLAALAIFLSFGIFSLTGGLFFLLPRSANAALSRLVSRRMHLPGFSNEVSLDQIGRIKNDSRAVMHVRPDSKDFPSNLKWRGVALSEFDGRKWSNPPGEDRTIGADRPFIMVYDRQSPSSRRIIYTVDLNAADSDALFVAGRLQRISLKQSSLIQGPNESYRLGFVPFETIRYGVWSVLEDSTGSSQMPDYLRERYLALPRLDPRIHDLALNIVRGLPSDSERARAIEVYLRTQFGYTLELPDREVADPIANFLFNRRKGHCEYFASAMTVMLRSIGIPARLVNGFQSGTFNPFSRLYVIRASDAHSWVEVLLSDRGWTTFDPTPPDPSPRPNALLAKLALWADAAETFWQDWVLRYDLGRQLVLAERLEKSSRRFGMEWLDDWTRIAGQWKTGISGWASANAVAIAAFLLVGIAAVLAGPSAWRSLHMLHRVRRVRYGKASVGDATVLYARMLDILRRRGFQKPAWFTPSEFAASLPAETAILVKQFTAVYNEFRFGGKLESAPRLTLLLEELETGRTGIPALPSK